MRTVISRYIQSL